MDLSINSKFFHFMTKVADCMILSVLWIVFSLPIVTAGAATAALYYCVVKVIRKEEGAVLKDFWRGFRTNLKQGTVVTLLTLAISLLVVAAGSVVYAATQSKEVLDNVYFVYLILLAFGVAWLHYIFSYIARFQAPLKTILKNSLVICLVNLPSSLSMMILFVVVITALILTMPASAMTLLFLPAVYTLVTSFLLEKIYKKYMPEQIEPQEANNT